MPYNPLALTPFDPNLETNAVTPYTYTNLDDSIETIKTQGYFDIELEDPNNIAGSLKLNDRILVVASDTTQEIVVGGIFQKEGPGVRPNQVFTASVFQSEIFCAEKKTTVGGSATEVINIDDILATDLGFVQIESSSVGALTIEKVVPTADTLTVIFNADPGNDTVIAISIIRILRA